jgi:phosphoribosylformylglycinamidine synthase
VTRVAVVRFPGSNCDEDALRAAERAGASAHYVWHRDTDLGQADVVILPGGFAYGDYLRAGAIARFSPVMAAVVAHATAGGPVVGICNGFQVLCEAGLLPGALMRNAGLRFVSRPVDVRIETTDTPCTVAYAKGAIITVPVAHGEGRYVAGAETLRELEAEGRVVFRYVGANPNGSTADIAGITNRDRNVVGLMPHPERAADPLLGDASGAGVFASLVQCVQPVRGGSA